MIIFSTRAVSSTVSSGRSFTKRNKSTLVIRYPKYTEGLDRPCHALRGSALSPEWVEFSRVQMARLARAT